MIDDRDGRAMPGPARTIPDPSGAARVEDGSIVLDDQRNHTDSTRNTGGLRPPVPTALSRLLLRALADGLTLSRVGMAGLLVFLGLRQGQEALPLAVAIIIAGWTADTVDGHLAHLAGGEGQTLIGRHDVTIDVAFSLGGLAYFALSGYLSRWLALVYVLVAAIAFLVRPARVTAILLQMPTAVLPAVVTFVHDRRLLAVLVLWALALLVLDRRRFSWRLSQLGRGLSDLLGGGRL
ncbi:MAG: hypothetical protein HPY83_04345 [Anaerolineae bacterium]|nr:hypothetical protein [Anaerolineae bacterium]